MMDVAKEFRRLTQETNQGRDGRGRRYSVAARQLAARYCREQRLTGRPFSKIALDLGISTATLGRWLDSSSESTEVVGFREVTIAEEPRPLERSAIRVTLANGVRIEGLGKDDLIELAKALA